MQLNHQFNEGTFMRNALFALAFAGPLLLAGTAPSLADVDVDIGVGAGVGIPGIYVDPDYDDDYDRRRRGRLSCWEAKELIRDRGYRRVVTLDCRGRIYTFQATRRGNLYELNVNPRTHAVWRR
jgi:hypothetical protein